MGYFSDLSLSYTADDAAQDRRDGLTPPSATWQCAACIETDVAQRRDDHPELCQSCPVRHAERLETRRQIVISAYMDGAERARWFYQRTEAGAAAADRKLASLAQQGYTLKP